MGHAWFGGQFLLWRHFTADWGGFSQGHRKPDRIAADYSSLSRHYPAYRSHTRKENLVNVCFSKAYGRNPEYGNKNNSGSDPSVRRSWRGKRDSGQGARQTLGHSADFYG